MYPNHSYSQLNKIAEENDSKGIIVIPFGNGRERMFSNECPSCSIEYIDLNIHSRPNIVRAAIEGIAFGFVFGARLMEADGVKMKTIKAGKGNLYECGTFC